MLPTLPSQLSHDVTARWTELPVSGFGYSTDQRGSRALSRLMSRVALACRAV